MAHPLGEGGKAMSPDQLEESSWELHTLTPERWTDFEELFGEHGAAGGCWCMWWRLTGKEFDAQKGEGNRMAMKAIVDSGHVPGILAYHEGHPVGWCSVAPREEFPRLERSRILKLVDDAPVWSVVCFFIAKSYRRRGVARRLLLAALGYVRDCGGSIVEGYPVEPKKGSTPDPFAYHGLASMFRSAGFKEVTRRSETRPIMRYVIDPDVRVF
jgi:GNAT superfamily N-acetyltransferase